MQNSIKNLSKITTVQSISKASKAQNQLVSLIANRSQNKSVLFSQQKLKFQFSQSQQSVDVKEMNHFQQVNDWWTPTGEMRALWEYNILRIDFMKNILKQQQIQTGNTVYEQKSNIYKPLKGLNVLDAGCGGGLLSESLVRLGANVTGIDACENSIAIAQQHKKIDGRQLDQNLNYQWITVEDLLAQKGPAQFDMITSMEVIEHVQDKQVFIQSLSNLLKPGGILFLSTMSKTLSAYLELIIGAEYVLNVVKRGTHDWDKFINPQNLSKILVNNQIQEIQIQGARYDLINNEMKYTSSTDMYLYAGRKL